MACATEHLHRGSQSRLMVQPRVRRRAQDSCLPRTRLTELQHSEGIISTFTSLKSNLNKCLHLYSSCRLRGGKPIVHTDSLSSPFKSASCIRKQITAFFFFLWPCKKTRKGDRGSHARGQTDGPRTSRYRETPGRY